MSNPKSPNEAARARTATLAQLRETVLPAYLDPLPHDDTLRAWFDRAKIPRLKSNPHAKRGGGLVYYSVSAVEKMLKQQLPGRLHPTEFKEAA